MRSPSMLIISMLMLVQFSCNGTAGREYSTGLKLLNQADGAKRAETHFMRAARGGHAGAQLQLGLLLTRPERTPSDRKSGVDWLTRSANRKNAHAQYALAMILLGSE
ncbi:hypothetical protein KKC22_09540, partial [Myxococcota bacterium]|nr:hypothetical protein [Myxococcota bacterium]